MRLGVAALLCLALAGCGLVGRRVGGFARKRADKAAYGIIADKQRQALGEAADFSIDPGEAAAVRDLLARAARLDFASDAFTTPTPSSPWTKRWPWPSPATATTRPAANRSTPRPWA